jgi:hypothetical protein
MFNSHKLCFYIEKIPQLNHERGLLLDDILESDLIVYKKFEIDTRPDLVDIHCKTYGFYDYRDQLDIDAHEMIINPLNVSQELSLLYYHMSCIKYHLIDRHGYNLNQALFASMKTYMKTLSEFMEKLEKN